MKRLRTGGPLNTLNELCNCNARRRTVAVMDLLDKHPTADAGEVESLIARHHEERCPCGIVSMGTVASFGAALFEAQTSDRATEWRAKQCGATFTREECEHFMRTLFCEAPIRGKRFELASRATCETTTGRRTRRATTHEDFDLGVDYVVLDDDGATLYGVQVKPSSFWGRAQEVAVLRAKHERCPYPVVMHVYDSEGSFPTAFDELVRAAMEKTETKK